jgi:hypothetical protein
MNRLRGSRLLGAAALVLLGGCVKSSVAVYRQAAIAPNDWGLMTARPGTRIVFERGRITRYPIPFVWSGGTLLWDVAPEQVVAGAVFTLPDTAITAIYQRFGHPMRQGFHDVRGTIRLIEVADDHVTADVRVRSDSARQAVNGRVRYVARSPD